VEHWANGGHTRLSNLVMLCHHHHQLVHEGGFTLDLDADGLTVDVRAPDGRRLVAVPERAPHGPDRDAGELPGPQSLFPLGAGTPWDLGAAVDALLAWTDGHPGGRTGDDRGLS
jgi:hypothetical protein